MGEFLQSFDIRNKTGISPAVVLGAFLLLTGLAGHLRLLDAVITQKMLTTYRFLHILPNFKTGLVYAVIGAALIGIGLVPDKYVRADLYSDAIVLYRKSPKQAASAAADRYSRDSEHVTEEDLRKEAEAAAQENTSPELTNCDIFLFDDLDAIVSSQRGLGDPQTLLIVPEKGKRVQVMVPPRNGMPAEAEAVWTSYCVRYNREMDAREAAGKDGQDAQG